MGTYSGRMWFDPDPGSKLRVEVELDTERLKITAHDDDVIGDWEMSEFTVRSVSPTQVHLAVEGEEVIVSSRDPDFSPAFAHVAEEDTDHTGPRLRAVAGTSFDDGMTSIEQDEERRRSWTAEAR